MMEKGDSSTNIAALVDRKSKIHPSKIAVIDGDNERNYTYKELKIRSSQCANYLMKLGVQRGNTVVFIGNNTIEAFDLLLACSKVGGTFVPLNFRLNSKELERIIHDCNPAVIFCDPVYIEKVEKLQSNELKIILTTTCSYLKNSVPRIDWDYSCNEEAIALIYTSGTTGTPKGVIQTHKNAYFRAIDSIIDFEMTSQDVNLLLAPLFHVAGFNALTLSVLILGAQLVLQSRFQSEQALAMIARHKVTCLGLPPTILKMLMNASNFEEEKIKSLRFILVGGETLEDFLQQKWRDMGVELLNTFGMSETADGVIYQRLGDKTKTGCVGKVGSHVDVKLILDGVPGTEGELWIGGPTVSPGYWNLADKANKTIQNGWVKSGDLAYSDDEENYYIIGRSDDLIKSGAEKVAPTEIENVISQLPEVLEVVVIGVPDEKWGQVPKAIIGPKPNVELTEQAVLDICAQTLANYKRPKYILFLDELPKTGSGKADRALLKKRYG